MDKKRVIAFVIDYLVCCLIQAVLMGILIFRAISRSEASGDDIFTLNLVITLISSLFLIFRDCFGNKSIGKRIMKLNVVDSENESSVGFARRLLRNITWLLGPIEVICFIFSGKRIGDMLARTTVREERVNLI